MKYNRYYMNKFNIRNRFNILDDRERLEALKGTKSEITESVLYLENEICNRYNIDRKTARKYIGECLHWTTVIDEICKSINYFIDEQVTTEDMKKYEFDE